MWKPVSLLLIVWATYTVADPVPLVFWHGMGKELSSYNTSRSLDEMVVS